ncbi:MAG: 2-amino-4-hydroxy-6-hydroxymethyldihydropteridine diphosphokinase [Candidatus Omnitrophica bacterium]|nr:2-amino-4-hydroxy-6-hydroxymethyldihydropteridine diphosphokinase [Candidatus Omnitrophota bacterium]
MTLVFLGLGSNIGDRMKNIQNAVNLLSKKISIKKVSTIIETDPVDCPPQEKYLNAVLKASTKLSAHELLETTQKIEKTLGRVRAIRNAPRTIDIDILLYGNERIHDKNLIIPHPRMRNRAFVMNPLNEIDATLAKKITKKQP